MRTVFGGGIIPLACKHVDAGILGSGTRCNSTEAKSVFQITGQFVKTNITEGPDWADDMDELVPM